ncbi:thioredoxin domain-containing protein [Agreia sp. VKM Ac-1783]|jgi:thiol-disulfide isomerase/thioredoxin|uniref:thioredoxin domain-containing protein n=1 Tax=Agreia sp. VKM Ac-1783 TaxID=1938889 RepID=UPI000A2AAD49|nr:thioredoxin domain-containing protein [Agreia sp. VKM Ac-1783]SMQ71471.1 Thioredoxin [Agreia sp. VKM Ac-1783]
MPLSVHLYSSSFCGACTQTRDVLERVKPFVRDRVDFSESNVASSPDDAERASIIATPTVVVRDESGTELARASGVPTADQVLTLLARHL